MFLTVGIGYNLFSLVLGLTGNKRLGLMFAIKKLHLSRRANAKRVFLWLSENGCARVHVQFDPSFDICKTHYSPIRCTQINTPGSAVTELQLAKHFEHPLMCCGDHSHEWPLHQFGPRTSSFFHSTTSRFPRPSASLVVKPEDSGRTKFDSKISCRVLALLTICIPRLARKPASTSGKLLQTDSGYCKTDC